MSSTRCSPNRCWRPSVALKTPPFRPTSSPRMQTRSSRSISSYSASRTACTRLRSGIGIYLPAERPWVGVSRSLRRLGGSLALAVDLLAKAGIGLGRQPAPLHQRIPHPGDRITRGFRSELCRIAVGPLVIIGGMRLQAQHFCLDQGGALAGAGTLGRLSHCQMDGEEIIAVDAHARNTVAGGSLGNTGPGNLQRRGHGDCPAIVLTEEDHRAAMDRREVEPFVEVTLAGGALTKTDVTQGSLSSPLQRQADAGRFGNLRPDRAGANDHTAAAAAEIARRLTATARGVGRTCERR